MQTMGTAASADVHLLRRRIIRRYSITPATVTAGTDTMIEVDGFNTNFAEGQTVIGFGSSDVTVRRTWIINPGQGPAEHLD